MELALVRESASCEQGGRGVRIKLHFEDRSILSPEQLLEGLSDSWFLLRPHLRSIADLAADIGSAFHLLKACPHGVFLRMEDFTLPPSQPVWLLKDKDVVSVNKKGVPINSAHQGVKHGNGSSLNTFDKIWLAGVNPHAIEEFERETGGYESEEEEDAQEIAHEDLGDMAKSPEISSRKSKQKKRKRDESERVAEQEGSLKLQVVPYTGGHTGKKEKKSKKQRLIMQQNDKEENVFAADEMQKCQKDKKARELGTSKANGSRKQKRVTAIGSRNDVASDSEDPTVKKHSAKNGIHKNATLSSSSSGEQLQDEEKKPVLQVEGESVKKPSRSTLRKKAKRRWKREHDGEALATKNIEKPADGRSKTAAYSDTTKPLSLAFPTKHEDDGEAEEERLPLVVRPGHIRFEPLDEDDDDSLHAQHTLPLLGWNNGISKRKGQSWGQEKARRGGKNLIGSDDMEICNSQAIEFETLPPLAMAPQNGDVVAYRLLELTPSLCPEVSEYRVGKVVDLENHSGILKLAEVPKYPLKRRPEYQDAETDRDIDFPSSYDKEGFLETQLSSLVDIRLVEGGSLDTHNIESRIQVPTELAIMNSCTNYSTEATPLLSDTKAEVSKNLVIIPNSSKACSPTKQKPDIPYSAWQEISKELDRKKEELTRREGITSTSLQTRATELGKFKNESGSSCGGNTRKETSTGRSKTWRKRAGGLGSIVALLRSENVV